jgi:ABC-2 type transport system permease protein
MSTTVMHEFSFRPRTVAAIMRRDLRIARSYGFALVFDITFGLVELFIYFFISRTFMNSPTADLEGAPTYFAFVAVGIVITLVIGAASAGVAERIRNEQQTGTLEALAAQPISTLDLCLGMVSFPFVFALLRGALYLGVAIFALNLALPEASWVGFLTICLVAGTALLSLGIALASFVVAFQRGSTVSWVLAFGLGFAGGAYFPISVLPGWLRALTVIVPTRYVFDGARSALFQGENWTSEAAILTLYSAVSLPIAVWVFSNALLFAKRKGTLSEY